MFPSGQRLRKFALAFALIGGCLGGGDVWSRDTAMAVEAPVVSKAELPGEARATEQLIRQGGPFPYAKDGSVFGNRERLLPARPRGFYREYTVPTPGLRHRGARRIVCGGKVKVEPEACYYTDDHYASFRLIAQ